MSSPEIVRELVDGAWRTTVGSAGGGGSQPIQVAVTFTAAEVAAAWDNDSSSAAMEVAEIAVGDIMLLAYQQSNTLDQNIGIDSAYAYAAGATTADVIASGESASSSPQVPSPFTYITNLAAFGSAAASFLNAGSAYYFTLVGDAAPTEGECVVIFVKLPAPA